MTRMNTADRRRIADAVAQAERGTTGEIVCVLAQECSRYREVPLAWAAALSLLAPPLLAPAGLWPVRWPDFGWTSGHGGPPSAVAAVEAYALAQLALFAVVWLVANLPAVRRVLTPGTLKSHRVHTVAAQQFLATGMATDPQRTGVMILGSLRDRRVEVLAAPGIQAAVGDDAWAQAVAAVQAGMKRRDLAGGFVDAVGLCGQVLARHFPAGETPHANTVPDDLIEIEGS